MKFNLKNTSFVIVLLLITFSFWSCKDTEVKVDAKVSALVDGKPFNAAVATGLKTNNTITLTVASQSTSNMILSFKAELGTQKLLFVSDSSGGVNIIPLIVYQNLAGSARFTSNACTSNNGEIVITEIDTTNKTITGTFKSKVCTINSSVEITEGKINKAKYN